MFDLVEEESTACSSCEACGDELRAIGQDCVTVSTREEASASNVVQEDTAHRAATRKTNHSECVIISLKLLGVSERAG